MTKFFTIYDKIKKWLLLATFAFVLILLFIPFNDFTPYLIGEVSFLKSLFHNEIYPATNSKASLIFTICLTIINKLSMITFLSLSIIFTIFGFLNKKCYFSIPMAFYFFAMLLSYNIKEHLSISLYYKIPAFILFAAWLTLDLLSKYRDKAIAKFDPIIAKRAKQRAARKADKQAQADAEYKQSPEYRIEQLEKRVQELQAQVKDDDQ